MTAVRAAALPRDRAQGPQHRAENAAAEKAAAEKAAAEKAAAENAEDGAQSRPELRVIYRAGRPVAAAPVPAHTRPALSVAATPSGRARPLVPGKQPASPIRLTRRGRVVLAAAVAVLVVVLSLIAAGAAQAISHSGPRTAAGPNLAQVVVRPGQSLWSVAETADPDADTRLVIKQIVELNALNGDIVFAGQRLWVPRS